MNPVNTDGYMIAGYVLTFVSLGLYLLSLYFRKRNLQRDLEAYQSLNEEKK